MWERAIMCVLYDGGYWYCIDRLMMSAAGELWNLLLFSMQRYRIAYNVWRKLFHACNMYVAAFFTGDCMWYRGKSFNRRFSQKKNVVSISRDVSSLYSNTSAAPPQLYMLHESNHNRKSGGWYLCMSNGWYRPCKTLQLKHVLKGQNLQV